MRKLYSATTWTGPLRTKLTNQSVNWEQRMPPFFVNGPMKLKNGNNGLTTKIWNPTKLRRVAYVSQTLSLFDWFVSILFFQTFFDFSTFQTVSENYKILTIFFHNGLSPLHSIEIELSGGHIWLWSSTFPTATRACFRPSPRWNESTVDRKLSKNVVDTLCETFWGTMIKTTRLCPKWEKRNLDQNSGEMWCNI